MEAADGAASLDCCSLCCLFVAVAAAVSDAAAVGVGNFVNQNTTQQSYQDQLDVNGYYSEPSVQNSIQDNASAASAVGEYNAINQVTDQYSGQTNTDIDSYGHYYGH